MPTRPRPRWSLGTTRKAVQGVSLEVCLDHSLTHVYGTGIVVNKVPFSLQIMLGIHGASMCCKGSCISNKCFAVSSFFFSYVRGSMSKLRTCASSSRFLLDFFIHLFLGGGGGGGGGGERGRGVSKFGFTDFHGFINAYHACGTKHITDGHHATKNF